jgi:hypothetical protein
MIHNLEDQNIKFSFLGSIKLLTSNIPYGKRKLLILFDLLFTFRKWKIFRKNTERIPETHELEVILGLAGSVFSFFALLKP